MKLLNYSLLFILISYSNAYILCEKDADCLAGTCDDAEGICKCTLGQVLNSHGTQCIKLSSGPGEACEEDVQCTTIKGMYACVNKKCGCAEGWVYLKGRCIQRKSNGDECVTNDDCFDGFSYNARTCEDGDCICRDGFYNRANFDCRPESKSVGDFCIIDNDCQFDNSECDDGKCRDKESPKIYEYIDDYSDYEDDDINIYETESKAETCGNNAYWSNFLNKCKCIDGFTFKGSDCLKELGNECIKDEDCISNLCEDNICSCTQGNHYADGNMKCKKTPFAKDFKCGTEDTCKVYGKNYECKQVDLKNKKCACKEGFELNIFNLCEPSNECAINKDCEDILEKGICIERKCVCKENFIEDRIDKKCYPKLENTCTTDNDCAKHTPNSQCDKKKVCKCNVGYVSDNDSCIELKGMQEKCVKDSQCSNKIYNTYCNEMTGCECQSNFLQFQDSACLKYAEKIGDVCSNKQICNLLEGDVVCKMGKCQCASDMKPKANKRGCEMKNAAVKQNISYILYGTTILVFYKLIFV